MGLLSLRWCSPEPCTGPDTQEGLKTTWGSHGVCMAARQTEPLALTPRPQSPVLLKASLCYGFFPALRKAEGCLSPLQTLSSARDGLPSLVHSNVPSVSMVPAL